MPYIHIHQKYQDHPKRGAGIFIYDESKNSVLLVQTWGIKWGPPKGHCDSVHETYKECAIRETKEESGIEFTETQFEKSVRLYRYKIYYSKVSQDDYKTFNGLDKEITAIQWFSIDDLVNRIISGDMDMNMVGLISFEYFLRWKKLRPPTFRFFEKKKRNHRPNIHSTSWRKSVLIQ